jgi:2-polyprenyl-6-methoxyphenol hydroxylase-like FAD-dependent oxidoreductase
MTDLTVRGTMTADELAALLAALTRRRSAVEDAYERWRRGRIEVMSRLRAVPGARCRGDSAEHPPASD